MKLIDFIEAFRQQAPILKGKCFYCGVQTERSGLRQSAAIFMTRDHVIPTSAKGGDRRANKVVCCRKCNTIKEDLTLHEFKRRSGITLFFAEGLLGVQIDDLDDIAVINAHVLNTRKIDGRSIKFGGKPEPRVRVIPSSTPSEP